MKQVIFLFFMLIGINSYAQFGFNSYERATLKLRNGKEITGEAKITNGEKVKFKNGKEKAVYDYRSLDRFEINSNGQQVSYIYKIIAGKEPRLLKIVREYPGRINLFVIEYKPNSTSFNHSQTSTITTPDGETAVVNTSIPLMNTKGPINKINEYYVNKGSGHEVIKIGNDHPIFGKSHFKKMVHEFLKIVQKS